MDFMNFICSIPQNVNSFISKLTVIFPMKMHLLNGISLEYVVFFIIRHSSFVRTKRVWIHRVCKLQTKMNSLTWHKTQFGHHWLCNWTFLKFKYKKSVDLETVTTLESASKWNRANEMQMKHYMCVVRLHFYSLSCYFQLNIEKLFRSYEIELLCALVKRKRRPRVARSLQHSY